MEQKQNAAPLTVRYSGDVPATLRRWCDAHAHQVVEVDAGYGYATDRDGGFAYDVLLRPGWSMSDDACHTLIEPTVKAMLAQLRIVAPCDCDSCMAEKSR
ncbi:hypothetical protein ACGLHS_31635 [Variovorax sp. VaC1]|uniref:hypothetical protein n=1 Tax=Variovorax sp. VaC1 TaxID=3373132 RepID=UPI003748575E